MLTLKSPLNILYYHIYYYYCCYNYQCHHLNHIFLSPKDGGFRAPGLFRYYLCYSLPYFNVIIFLKLKKDFYNLIILAMNPNSPTLRVVTAMCVAEEERARSSRAELGRPWLTQSPATRHRSRRLTNTPYSWAASTSWRAVSRLSAVSYIRHGKKGN